MLSTAAVPVINHSGPEVAVAATPAEILRRIDQLRTRPLLT
jgi:hypothetical protein